MRLSHLRILAPLVALAGCASGPDATPAEPVAENSVGSGRVLRVDGEAIVLGAAASTPMPLRAYVAQIEQAVAEGRDDDVAQLVRTFPDLAERAILSGGTAPRTQQTVAAWLDGAAAPARGGWALFVSDRAENPGRYEAWAKRRAEAWSALRRGAFDEVAGARSEPVAEASTPWPAADLDIVANAGHSSLEPGIVDKLIRATREFGRRFR